MTPDETLESMLGGSMNPKPTPKTEQRRSQPSKTTAPQKLSHPSTGESHKLSITVPHDVYLAMQLHKSAKGAALGEKSLQDIGLNAIKQYVGGYTDVARSLLS